MKQHIPMLVTWMRILLVPLILALLEWDLAIAAVITFIIAGISDWLDGYLARLWNATTNMGKFMDPIADKILVSSLLVYFAAEGVIDPYLVIIIMARDTLIGGIRSVAAANGVIIAAKSMGKWKTAIQMVCLPLCMLTMSVGDFSLQQIGYWGLWVSVALSVISGFDYAFGYIKGSQKTSGTT